MHAADGHVLVHCHAGISRSTAAAAILMTPVRAGNEEEAFLKLLDLRKHGWPNTRMIEFADTLLKRDGAMLRGLLAYRKALLEVKPHLERSRPQHRPRPRNPDLRPVVLSGAKDLAERPNDLLADVRSFAALQDDEKSGPVEHQRPDLRCFRAAAHRWAPSDR